MKDQKFAFGVKHLAYNAEMRKRREAMNLYQRELGEMCGISGQLISHIEGFRHWPSLDQQEKISKALNTTPKTLFPEWMKAFKVKKSSFSTEHIITERLLPSMVDSLSLPAHIDDTERKIDEEFMKEEVKNVLENLSNREARVIKMRFGIGDNNNSADTFENERPQSYGGEGKTLEETARVFGVTRERIRQVEAKALRKLKHPSKKAKLKDYLK